PGDFAAHGTVCHCEQAFGDSDVASPQSDLLLGYRTGCDVAGRSGDCLYGCSEFPGCDPGDATSCQALCADLDARLDADAERTFDAALRSAVCTTDGACGCRSVFRVEDHCYAGQAKLDTPYDCALTDEAILAQAFSASGGGVAGSSGTATQVDPNAPDQCD
ncbi:MAG: hypothetical protein ABI548_22785, partial [Polyangiaceae bacterium]